MIDRETLARALGEVLVTIPPAVTVRERQRDHRDILGVADRILAAVRAGEGEEPRPLTPDEYTLSRLREEPRAPQPDLRDALTMDLAGLRMTLPVLEGSGSYTTTVSVSMLRRLYEAALRATPVPASGLPSRDALAKALDRLARANRNYSPLFDSDDVRAADELNDALDEADAILATLAKGETTP